MFLLITIQITFGKIENEIKALEKSFSRKDFKDFNEKFQRDLTEKQYDFESAKVYETAKSQINLKKQKFNSVSQKMINDYGKKYEEIISKDISSEEKDELVSNLLSETKSYDEKNRGAILRLNSEYDNLVQNFQGKVQDAKTIYSQMQNLHLFDKNRYFEDMKASIKPELRDLYKKRYLLNTYRIEHNEVVFDGNKNIFSNFANNILNNFKNVKKPLTIGPHFERELPSYDLQPDNASIDKNLIKALASFYSNNVIDNKAEFEDYLVGYFKNHYRELIDNDSSKFLHDFSKFSSNDDNSFEEGDLFKIARFFNIDSTFFENCTTSKLVVKEGLIYEVTANGINVIYATDKSLNDTISSLYGQALYHKHLANENNLTSNRASSLQNNFIDYANQNGIEIDNNLVSIKSKKRFIKKKIHNDNQSNVIDFKTQSF